MASATCHWIRNGTIPCQDYITARGAHAERGELANQRLAPRRGTAEVHRRQAASLFSFARIKPEPMPW